MPEMPVLTFQIRDLSALSFAQGFTQWHYRAAGLHLAQVLAPGFFNAGAGRIATGDHIKVSAADGGADLYVHRATAKTVSTEAMASTLLPARKAAA